MKLERRKDKDFDPGALRDDFIKCHCVERRYCCAMWLHTNVQKKLYLNGVFGIKSNLFSKWLSSLKVLHILAIIDNRREHFLMHNLTTKSTLVNEEKDIKIDQRKCGTASQKFICYLLHPRFYFTSKQKTRGSTLASSLNRGRERGSWLPLSGIFSISSGPHSLETRSKQINKTFDLTLWSIDKVW